MYRYAQTNLQLYHQLRLEAYTDDDLKLIAQAYQLILDLFTGQFRSSGKTFIAHLVGTASILASFQVSIKVIAAGLLHAVYSQGDFGGLSKQGMNNAKRERVRKAVGQDVEEYIAYYTAFTWNANQIPKIYSRLEELDTIAKDVLLIRLANELEEYLDCGLLYCGAAKHQLYQEHDTHLLSKMAEYLGYPALGVEIAQVLQENVSTILPQELCNPTGQTFSSLVLPNSCQRKLPAWFYYHFNQRFANLKLFARSVLNGMTN
ncbi:DUF6817 domain-containing protein [Chroococcus sp. FPU101]|uniref:DUF6817 domain-containing protein n=1 Tax=Chroococcus sp. FPU101 TaxID=1974212 RepID=UPI001A8EDB7F|nr:HD domain-containing protein [Chroococcus sp. FPU101]GFE67659.1 hypothetical protein CFPU101_02690 [Chroococcus sp. FPU101]